MRHSGQHVAQSHKADSASSTGGAADPAPTAVTIGTFDGVHRGHSALVQAAHAAVTRSERARRRGRIIAMVFDPHPLEVLRPNAAPPRISAFAQRVRWLRALGADEVVQLEPTPQFLGQAPGEFIAQVIEQWRPAFIVEGGDFRFGRSRAGSIDTLREHEREFGYRTLVVDPVEVALRDQSIVRVSSSLVRWMLAHGRVEDAATLLGREHEVEARIVQGDRRGRELGFPTANLLEPPQLLPADGIYAGVAERDGRHHPAAISIGSKPTFGSRPRTCEAHLLDYDGPLDDYGWEIRLQFTHWLRDQLTFADGKSLCRQMEADVARVRMLGVSGLHQAGAAASSALSA